MIYVSNDCMSQANKFKTDICKVLSKTKTQKSRKDMYAYGLQMFHEELEIKAAGFFIIDFALIFAIISAASTYVVIILQFLYYESQ
ncbi:unnamed protein product, partial [Tenebrio molitor]